MKNNDALRNRLAKLNSMKRLDTRRLANPRFCLQSVAPVFGENYKPGFVGFTYFGSGLLSRGIAHFTRWSRMSDIHVTGVLVVTGENAGVEVTEAGDVVKVDFGKYFDDVKTQIFFRKPRKCSAAVGLRISQTAVAQMGTKFDQLLLAARILEGSFLRRWALSHFRDEPGHFAAGLGSRERRWLGAELAAYCLDCQPEYADRGLLASASHGITPQELFEDEELFSAWNQEPEEGPKHASAAE